MINNNPHVDGDNQIDNVEDNTLHVDDAAEEVDVDDGDAPMDDASDDEQIDQVQNDAVAHFNLHKDSIFCISRHPVHQNIVATGSGDDSAYVFDIARAANTNGSGSDSAQPSLEPLAQLQGHTDSVNAIAFSLPHGEYVLTAGLDGQIRAYATTTTDLPLVTSNKEVDEINFLLPNPSPHHANTFAAGASDGSVWVYELKPPPNEPGKVELNIIQAYYVHTAPVTAGSWTPNGAMLVTVSEDSSLCAWDPFGEASSAGMSNASVGQAIFTMSGTDERFRIDGGLFSVAVSPSGGFAAAGGAGGGIRIVGLPRFDVNTVRGTTTAVEQGAAVSSASSRNRQQARSTAVAQSQSSGQAGVLLSSLNEQSDSVESIAFSAPPLTLMATGSVDGSIVLYDASQRFGVRRHIRDAHSGEAVIKLEYSSSETGKLLSCGNDGVLRVWDVRGGSGGTNSQGLTASLHGHRGGGDGGGIFGFVQSALETGRQQVVTAGDDGISLVFDLSW